MRVLKLIDERLEEFLMVVLLLLMAVLMIVQVVSRYCFHEDVIDSMADHISNYLVSLSAHISQPEHTEILNHYHTVVTEFERLATTP